MQSFDYRCRICGKQFAKGDKLTVIASDIKFISKEIIFQLYPDFINDCYIVHSICFEKDGKRVPKRQDIEHIKNLITPLEKNLINSDLQRFVLTLELYDKDNEIIHKWLNYRSSL